MGGSEGPKACPLGRGRSNRGYVGRIGPMQLQLKFWLKDGLHFSFIQ